MFMQSIKLDPETHDRLKALSEPRRSPPHALIGAAGSFWIARKVSNGKSARTPNACDDTDRLAKRYLKRYLMKTQRLGSRILPPARTRLACDKMASGSYR
jgi:hypothetical protein